MKTLIIIMTAMFTSFVGLNAMTIEPPTHKGRPSSTRITVDRNLPGGHTHQHPNDDKHRPHHHGKDSVAHHTPRGPKSEQYSRTPRQEHRPHASMARKQQGSNEQPSH